MDMTAIAASTAWEADPERPDACNALALELRPDDPKTDFLQSAVIIATGTGENSPKCAFEAPLHILMQIRRQIGLGIEVKAIYLDPDHPSEYSIDAESMPRQLVGEDSADVVHLYIRGKNSRGGGDRSSLIEIKKDALRGLIDEYIRKRFAEGAPELAVSE